MLSNSFVRTVPPYWTPYGDRMYYVDKDCDTRTNCYNEKDIIEPWCKRDWYDDWACIECCSGDLCNYYVTVSKLLHIDIPCYSTNLKLLKKIYELDNADILFKTCENPGFKIILIFYFILILI